MEMDFIFSKVTGIDGYFKSIFPDTSLIETASKGGSGQRRFSKLSSHSIILVLISISQCFHLFSKSFMIKTNKARHT